MHLSSEFNKLALKRKSYENRDKDIFVEENLCYNMLGRGNENVSMNIVMDKDDTDNGLNVDEITDADKMDISRNLDNNQSTEINDDRESKRMKSSKLTNEDKSKQQVADEISQVLTEATNNFEIGKGKMKKKEKKYIRKLIRKSLAIMG